MWKEYSKAYIKNNRSSSIAIMAAVFISSLFLSLLCGLFYNMWKYEVERIELENGSWHSRIVGELTEEDIEAIKNFASVKNAVMNEKKSNSQERAVDIYFSDRRRALDDTPQIASLVGIDPRTVVYHHELLAMYLIRDPMDPAPRLVFPVFLLIVVLASFSLIIIIHNAFAVSINARVHQFGIFSSIGAEPKQIRSCLLQEAAALSALPVLAGNLLGIAGSMGLLHMTNVLLGNSRAGRHDAVFGYHPLVFAVTLFATVITIWISAWLPARKLSRMTPLEAIRSTEEFQLKHKRKSPVLALLFGMEGELAGSALKAQRKALRTSSLSLIISFMAFTMMQIFFTLSGISTRETYFEKYQDAWDIMVTVKDTAADSFENTAEIQGLSEVKSAVVYQKAMAKRMIAEDEISEEMKAFGGFSHASGNYVTKIEEGWLVNAPIVILDDNSFLDYCKQLSITPRLDGAIIRNQICDVTNPDFRHPQYMPYVNGKNDASVLRRSGQEDVTAEIPVLSYTDQVPVLREKYASLDYYELVHFLPVSLWRKIKGQIGGCEENTYIRVLAEDNISLEELDKLQNEINRILAKSYEVESENRIREKMVNDSQIQGMMTILGGFCLLLAMIGIGNVFSNTRGFVRQRRREFARYMSVGMTPKEMRKMFCIEGLVIAGRPVLFTLPVAVVMVWYFLKISYLEAETFLAEAPFFPIAVFMFTIWITVGLAYYLGWRSVGNINLAEVLRDDTMI